MPHLQIVVASTRPGRKGIAIARWVDQQAREHAAFDVELVDLAEVNLPLLDEPEHPRLRKYRHEHTKSWSARVERADAFVFVTPEYNNSTPPALSNAIDYLVHEWAYKPVGLVSYGGISGGLRGVQQTKLQLVALKMVPLAEAVVLPMFTQLLDPASGAFAADEGHARAARTMLNELERWTNALAVLRAR